MESYQQSYQQFYVAAQSHYEDQWQGWMHDSTIVNICDNWVINARRSKFFVKFVLLIYNSNLLS